MNVQPTHRWAVSLVLMSVMMLQVGCRGWIEKPIAPQAGIGIPQRGILRITKTDGAIITLGAYVLANDSIVGLLAAGHELRAAVARTDISKIEVRGDTTPSGVRIAGRVYMGALMVGGLVFLAAGLAYAIASGQSGN